MRILVGLITRWDNDPAVDFPHTYSSWADGPVVQEVAYSSELERGLRDVQTQTRSITQHGIVPVPVRVFLVVTPPEKYPPVRITRRECDSSVLAAIQANPQYMLLSVEDIGEGVPAGWENHTPNDELPASSYDTVATKIEALTRNVVGDTQADDIAAALAAWRAGSPHASALDFARFLKVFQAAL